MKILVKKIPIYTRRLIFILTKDFEKTGKDLNITFDNEVKTCQGLAFEADYKGQGAYYIFVKEKSYFDWSVIAHEALHVTNMIMKRACIPANNDNDEAHCYLLGWIVDEIHTHISRETHKEAK